uniref:Magnesium-dependent phosphatase-1 n=1 Tax=Proboscia inermis TaxID=420281 RepID=A0A7S0CJJ5_9STRA|mmetsp:Transcript_48503/g.48861  ORF Transcript_48503/g.48861 Transcript_48503/m.48861 type:complete len:254 (+) Transcript_48503:43-804(+)
MGNGKIKSRYELSQETKQLKTFGVSSIVNLSNLIFITSAVLVAFCPPIQGLAPLFGRVSAADTKIYASSRNCPRCIVLDLDNTLWNRPRFRRGPPFIPINDGFNGVRANSGEELDLYPGVRDILKSFVDSSDDKNFFSGTKIGLVSRSHRQNWSEQFLKMLRVSISVGLCRSVEECVDIIVIRDGPKGKFHLREIRDTLNISYADMLYFDDKLHEIKTAEFVCPGLVGVHCSNGFCKEELEHGLVKFGKSRAI